MKLATYKDGSRDGQLIVVSRDLSTAHYASGIANSAQQVLDDWNFLAPQLQDLYDALNRVGNTTSSASLARHAFPFNPQHCMAPLPRAYQWAVGAAYPVPSRLAGPPLMTLHHSDELAGPCDAVACASEAADIDFEAGFAVITGDVALGATPAQALDGIRLLALANVVCLRQPTLTELATAFSPVAVTPDELVFNGDSVWRQGRVHLSLHSSWNGRKVGLCDAAADMTFHFGELIAKLCQTRRISAGSIIGSGPVSNRDASRGFNTVAEKRAIETVQDGKPVTGFMKYGDVIRIEMKGRDGLSLFGAIEQKIVPVT